MKNKYLFVLLLLAPFFLFSQKKVGELTLVYNYAVESSGDAAGKQINATASFFIKGNLSRAEIDSRLFSSATIYDSKTRSGVILKEVNGQKLLIRLDEENWNQKNSKFNDISFTKTAETKMIAGYACSQAIAKTADGYEIKVFYTRDLMPENKTYDPPFKNLDGLPLEYEFSQGKLHIRYVLASVNLNPVPASKFDIPTSGYREMTYDESRKMKAKD